MPLPRKPLPKKTKPAKTPGRIKQKPLPTIKTEKEAIENLKKNIKDAFNKKKS
ncbi:MAG: hypothetical protein WCY27_01275 [archaeon]|jgi:hypothetical protein|nr:hypothetical protein [archaeon]MDD2477958.1 hypothetical protein [Candidatus ainarchaeum sp.]MDD3084952.1 hypothetical protein [Candidatus ainarchaeum sp.]MDD4221412.1 hypothetical protein [Candidatus ainarchaeum sp.]MDD4662948.1 hypothetical protein [Candidatus ainarchaeum sp.]